MLRLSGAADNEISELKASSAVSSELSYIKAPEWGPVVG
jgi:hypothetical protein